MVIRLGLLAFALVAACDGPNCRSQGGNPRILGSIPAGDSCRSCTRSSRFESPEGDAECAAAYGGGLGAGCVATCRDGMCVSFCPEDCAQAPACVTGSCGEPGRAGVRYCDPLCGSGGGCRSCLYDAECQTELGPEGRCQRHCGLCCRPEDTSLADGGMPCWCI